MDKDRFQLDPVGGIDLQNLTDGNPYGETDLGQFNQNQADMAPWKKFGIGLNAVTGLAGAINAFRNSKLQKQQFGFNKSLANRNIANSAITTNQQLGNQASLAAQLAGGHEYGTEAFKENQARRYNPVDGSPVG